MKWWLATAILCGLRGCGGLCMIHSGYEDRRSFLAVSNTAPALVAAASVASAAATATADELPTLRERVEGGALRLPGYSVETSDVYYPKTFAGVWECRSSTVAVEAPCGNALFGGNRTFERAKAEVGTSLMYSTRFRYAGPTNNVVVADRAYNIESICRATMGANAVLDVPRSEDPNELAFILSPEGAEGQLYRADLKVVGRHSEVGETTGDSLLSFDVCEVVRQVVSPANPANPASIGTPRPNRPPLIKDIETTTLYRQISPDCIVASQKTLSFLVPDPNQDPAMAGYIVRVAQGRAVDVRTYDVVYRRVRELAASNS